MQGKLFVVPTPIGNIEDITIRAKRVLAEADLILAEDTRTTGKLLKLLHISNKMSSNHLHNEHQKLEGIVQFILSGNKVALVSDAGTPAISDPGFLLVRECVRNNIEVETLPGAVALIPALVNSALPNERFCFEGFLPPKKGRNKRLLQIQHESRTMVFYESPYRLLKTLKQFVEIFGNDRNASVSRELSKIYEENVRGTLSELIEHFSNKTIKGEIVIVVEGEKIKN